MATDYAEMEREFLNSLEADTGHDLAGWMALIDRQNLGQRNDIIDWLRTQRFAFSWASWLERIHHNGGRPIYNAPFAPPAATPAKVDNASVAATPAAPSQTSVSKPAMSAPAAPATPAHVEPPASAANENSASLSDLLAKGKAYRMLAEHLIREVRRAIPEVTVSARGVYISLAHPSEFAAITVSPKEIRLGMPIPEPAPAEFSPGRMTGTDVAVSHVIALTDARQITPALIEAIRRADKSVNGG